MMWQRLYFVYIKIASVSDYEKESHPIDCSHVTHPLKTMIEEPLLKHTSGIHTQTYIWFMVHIMQCQISL